MINPIAKVQVTDYRAKISPSQKSKLGEISSFSIPAGEFEGTLICVGWSDVCREVCYVINGATFAYPTVQKAYKRNFYASQEASFADDIIAQLEKLEAKNKRKYGADFRQECRIHVSGDFYSMVYVMKWIKIIKACPEISFFAYTKSWVVRELMPSLEQLRALPNMQLFASVDESMPMPPEGWRVAYMETDDRFRGMECLEQNGKMPDCKTCGYCYRKPAGNVKFLLHANKAKQHLAKYADPVVA